MVRTTAETTTVAPLHAGPPGTGNGGWVCGLLTERLDPSGHPYPGCYVCGPEAEAGLRVFAAPVAGRDDVLAAPVTITDEGLPPVLAALDCPGAFAVGFADGPLLLGTLTSTVTAAVPRARELVVIAWETGREGRKRHTGTALLDGERVLASAAATWIAPAPRQESS